MSFWQIWWKLDYRLGRSKEKFRRELGGFSNDFTTSTSPWPWKFIFFLNRLEFTIKFWSIFWQDQTLLEFDLVLFVTAFFGRLGHLQPNYSLKALIKIEKERKNEKPKRMKLHGHNKKQSRKVNGWMKCNWVAWFLTIQGNHRSSSLWWLLRWSIFSASKLASN